jgi:hypothetical protein
MSSAPKGWAAAAASPAAAIPAERWKSVSMNLIVMLPHTADRFDPICVVVDCPTKVAHFVPPTPTCTAICEFANRVLARRARL